MLLFIDAVLCGPFLLNFLRATCLIETTAVLDANANQVVAAPPPPPPPPASVVDERAGPVKEESIAALTDLCGRQLLSPSFFLGASSSPPPPPSASAPSSSSSTLNISGGGPPAAAAAEVPATKPRLSLRSHKMAGLKDLLMSEKLNTHAISLQLTAQSQVQLGSRLKQQQPQGDADATKDAADQNVPANNNGPSRPKRTRKEV